MTSTRNVRVLRTLLVLHVGLFVVSTALGTLFSHLPRWGLPKELSDLVERYDQEEFSDTSALWLLLCALIFLCVWIAGLVGLWKTKPWGRIAYTLACLALFAAVPLLVAFPVLPAMFIRGPYDAVTASLLDMCAGAILYLIWFGMDQDFDTKHAAGDNQSVAAPT
jgi:hypothetical protein